MSDMLYSLSGLVFSSPLPCPELEPSQAVPQVTARFGVIPPCLAQPYIEGVGFQARPGQLLLDVKNVARFLVEAGETVTIERAPGTTDDVLRLFLLNVVFAVLLHQRGGVLPLHASGVRTGHGAVLFAGYSGAGKSTLAAEFVRRGCGLLSDDLVPIQSQDRNGPLVVWPVFGQVKLWADAARHLGYEVAAMTRLRPEEEKYSVRMDGDFSLAAVPVRAVYVLAPYSQPAIKLDLLDSAQKFMVLLYRTAGMPFLEGLGLRGAHFQMVTALAPRIRLTRVWRPVDRMTVAEVADAIEMDLITHTEASGGQTG